MFLSNIYAVRYLNWQKVFSGFLLCGILVSGSTVFASGVDPQEKSGEVQQKEKTPTLISLKKNPAFYAQSRVNHTPDPVNSPRLFNQFLSGLAVGGYYRNLMLSRKMSTPYGEFGRNKVMQVGESFNDPVVMLYVGGNPTPVTSFGAELMLANPFTVYNGAATQKRIINPYFNMILRGSTNTKYGNFGLLYGGIEWKNLTMFTFGSNVGYNRYTLFERNAWDPVGNIKNRYASYYYTGTINQDQRWGTQGFKGIMLNGWNMPFNTSVDLYYGKTQYLAGVVRQDTTMPSYNFGLKLSKALKNDSRISLNTFSSTATSDSINSLRDVKWQVYTTEFSFNLIKGLNLSGELGMGSYESPAYKQAWGEGIVADLNFEKSLTKIPFSLRYFQIGKYFTNNVASFTNNSIREVYDGYVQNPTAVILVPNAAGLMGPGGLANNQRGFGINTSFEVKKFKISLGNQFSSEMDTLENGTQLSFSHRINGLQWGRLPLWFPNPGQLGPNGRIGTFYRGAYEIVKIDDPALLNADSSAKFLRHFNGIDAQVKYKTKLFNKDLYINYLGSFQSAQKEFSPVTVFTPDAFIRAYYNELEAYYQLSRTLIVSTYVGYERILGNSSTEVDPVTMLPRNQVGKALGFGCDFAISSSTTVFFRHRWMSFEDKNFKAYHGPNPNDPGAVISRDAEAFKGHESTIEIKIFF